MLTMSHNMDKKEKISPMMLENDILFNLSIRDYMFITFIIENFEGCSTAKLIGIGHTHRLVEA